MMAKFTRSTTWIARARGWYVRSAARPGSNRGVALLFALLLLTLMSALGIIMVLTVSPDMMINGYYGNYRGSFYAADSGMNIARQQLLNLTQAQVNMTPCIDWQVQPAPCNNPPLQGTTGATVLNNLKTTYASFTPLQGGQARNSWPENFEIADTSTCTNSFAIANGYPVITHAGNGQNANYKYGFSYNLCTLGRAQGGQQVATTENGLLFLNVTAQTSTSQQVQASFASFGAFINNYPPCLGPLVPGTMTGPMFTNGAWQFMTGGAYIFTDPVGQANAKADYWFGGTCIQSPTSSYTYNRQTIAPTFQGGLNLNQASVPMPANDFSQAWAAVDGCGEGEGLGGPCTPGAPANNPTSAQLNAALKNVNQQPYPTNGNQTGVYMPYSCTGGPPCTNTVNGGGIYVKGNSNIVLSVGNDVNGNPTQIYSITLGGTTTTVTTNIATNTTTMVQGGTTLTLAGVPMNLSVNPPAPATMLYNDGTINSIRGTGQGVPAIQDGVALTVTANGDINCTGDLIYKHEPVTMNVNDTLIQGNDYNQDLGLFTATGNIVLSSPYSNHNLQVDGSQAAISSTCAGNKCGFLVNGCINTFNNVGGQIQANIFGACMTTQNTYFDRRYTSKPGFAPPWFPSTTVSANDVQNALAPLVTTPPPQRMSWVTTPQ